jgi:WD40 repeat protein
MPRSDAAEGSPTGELLFWGFDKIYAARVTPRGLGPLKVLSEGKVKNIISMSGRSSTLALTARTPASKELTAVILHLPDSQIQRSVGSEVYDAAIKPEEKQVATTSYNHDTGKVDITVWDLETGKSIAAFPSTGIPSALLAWHPDGKHLTYEVRSIANATRDSGTGITRYTYATQLETIDTTTGAVESLFPGVGPAWSPTGGDLAYYLDGTVFLYHAQPRRSVPLATLGKRELTGAVSWNGDGTLLSVNARAGPMAELLECFVVDVATGKARSLGTKTYSCGPWLDR